MNGIDNSANSIVKVVYDSAVFVTLFSWKRSFLLRACVHVHDLNFTSHIFMRSRPLITLHLTG